MYRLLIILPLLILVYWDINKRPADHIAHLSRMFLTLSELEQTYNFTCTHKSKKNSSFSKVTNHSKNSLCSFYLPLYLSRVLARNN